MLVNPVYGASGSSPTPSSGYVEDKLLYYYEGNEEKLSFNKTEMTITESRFWAPPINSTDGWTLEVYFELNGTSTYTWQGTFGLSASHTGQHLDIFVGDVSGSIYKLNPYFYWGSNVDDILDNELILDNKYTVSLVSVVNESEETSNTIYVYINGTPMQKTYSQSRDVVIAPYSFGIEDSSISDRPMNGKLYNGRFYTRALTAAELTANHANDIAKYGGNS